ncbi:PAS domain-containing protein [Kineococcus xinjiangensis]|uniref:PAS domain-containing protein n=1 Tax=Kineococcus xinjiangensis TaxID=512762 RepID=A0A2S6IKA9_9ACTN|nr:SpoIIE family protein phosphatase [Kineococcus xinjiangensis]PPK94615.1 PAS domain-containing protein [Kineococcus xinjiangensis]
MSPGASAPRPVGRAEASPLLASPGAPGEAPAYVPAYGQVDLTNCDREPIHVPGAVQPHGVLLAVDPAGGDVVVASASATALLGVRPEELLGRPLAEVLGREAAEVVLAASVRAMTAEPLRTRLLGPAGELAGREVDVIAHPSGGRLVVEVEPVAPGTGHAVSYRATRAAMARLTMSAGVGELCRGLAAEVRALTGFDRVMVYRFDAEWNGEVVAEERRNDLNSFLGLHYPSTDIPVQARRLYEVNWTRLIVDVGYVPSPLVPGVDPATDAPLDLSHSVLRSVSPIHVEYLRNMGVTASMSVSLMHDGRLWGLIACHHYSGPHRPTYDARSAAEFLGQVASQLIADREGAEEREAALAAHDLLSALMSDVAGSGRPPGESLLADPRLLQLVGARGAALWNGEVLRTAGRVPDAEALHALAAVLARTDGAPTFTDHVASLLPQGAAHAATAAGALRIGLGRQWWLLWLRPEQVEVVDWGGDPHNKALAAAEGPGVRLSPRKSFDKWREVVRGRSLPWNRWQAQTAERLGNQFNSLLVGRVREQITLAESLQRAVVPDASPQLAGLDVAARYEPAQGSQLGGDWWDAVELSGGRVAFVVGDVAGHGVQAATAMAQLRTALRVYLLDGHPAGQCLDRLDRLVATQFGEDMATAVVAVVDAATGRVELANAGHTPPLMLHAGGADLLLAPPRPLLGVGTGTATSLTLDLPTGALLLLYSDGLVERRAQPLDASLELLRSRVQSEPPAPGQPLRAWVEGLVRTVPGPADDDSTVLAVRRRGHDAG